MKSASQQTDTQIAVNKDLASAAKDQATAVRNSVEAMRNNTIDASRAWVGPSGATIDVAPVVGKAVDFKIAYQNTGRQPAVGFQSSAQPFVMITSEFNVGGLNTKLFDNLAECLKQQPIAGAQVVYPSVGFGSNQATVHLDGATVDDKVINGEGTIGAFGCFVYETFGTPHHSTYCFFYQLGRTQLPNLNFCAGGGYAD